MPKAYLWNTVGGSRCLPAIFTLVSLKMRRPACSCWKGTPAASWKSMPRSCEWPGAAAGRRRWSRTWTPGAEIHGHLLAGGTVTGAELPLQAGDGRRLLLEVSGSAASGLIQLEVRDATGREQERLAERFEMLRLLARRTAAEFHNLHRVLRTTGELLLVGGAGQGRPVPGELEEIQQASAIAGQLLAFSGGTPLQIRPVALNDLVESMLPRLRQLFGRDIEIVPDLSPDTALVMADPVQVRQIILNLAANSREAMERGGTFCLQTGNSPTVEPGLGNGERSLAGRLDQPL